MTHGEALKLLPGDEVLWTDTDDGGVRYKIKIKSIEVIDDRFHVTGEDGPNSVVHFECNPEELSSPIDEALRAAELAEERAIPSSATKYQLDFRRVDVTYATVEVEASSQEEADRIAEQMLQEGFEPDEDCRTVSEDVKLGSWVYDHADPVNTTMTAVLLRKAEERGLKVEQLSLPSVNIDDMLGLPVSPATANRIPHVFKPGETPPEDWDPED
jgi:hypothetical protein